MNPSEWNRIGLICRTRRVQAKIGLIDLQEMLGVESVSFIVRMERGEYAPDLLWDFWSSHEPMQTPLPATRLSA